MTTTTAEAATDRIEIDGLPFLERLPASERYRPDDGGGYEHFEVHPLTGALGAEIRGLDLRRPLDDEVVAELHRAWYEHLVIFFRDQDITPEDHQRVARYFGDPEIFWMKNAPHVEGHEEITVITSSKDFPFHAGVWHSDKPFTDDPPMGAVLRCVEMPPVGGDTLFASMYASYQGLPEELRERLDGMVAANDSRVSYPGVAPTQEGEHDERIDKDDFNDPPSTEHPMVRTHPVTGRKGLYVSPGWTSYIKGLGQEESQRVLKDLYWHMTRPEYTCRFRWEENSVLIWDNRCTWHYGVPDFYPHKRVLNRIYLKGEKPF